MSCKIRSVWMFWTWVRNWYDARMHSSSVVCTYSVINAFYAITSHDGLFCQKVFHLWGWVKHAERCHVLPCSLLLCDQWSESRVPAILNALAPLSFVNALFSRCIWAHWAVGDIHRDSKKGCHPNHGRNFVNSWSICKILSLLQRALNLQQNPY